MSREEEEGRKRREEGKRKDGEGKGRGRNGKEGGRSKVRRSNGGCSLRFQPGRITVPVTPALRTRGRRIMNLEPAWDNKKDPVSKSSAKLTKSLGPTLTLCTLSSVLTSIGL